THGRVRPAPRSAAALARGHFEPHCPRCDSEVVYAGIEEDAPADPRNAYATSKLAQEHLAANWARETGGTAVALRYHNVYGPRMPQDTPYSGVAAIFRSALEAGRAPRVFEDGAQLRGFRPRPGTSLARTSPRSAAAGRACWPRTTSPAGRPRSVGDMAVALATHCGGPEPVITGGYRLGDVRHIVAAPHKAGAELGFHARIGFDEGMKEFATAPLACPE
ncbi:NAD-dependent epimerase/dehydratase family protein, partial [Nonomuraea rubra]|uniref:NAD-dependent epimerase/dehydratase family protein n=1 Tax=Nonomuraea rubra TaxID=46180 RepID=UPI0031EC4398